MNSSRYLRLKPSCPRRPAAGRRVAFVTAKDKLQEILSKTSRACRFPPKRRATRESRRMESTMWKSWSGKRRPPFTARRRAFLSSRQEQPSLKRPCRFPLPLHDRLHPAQALPEDPVALDFYARVDRELGRILDLGAVVGLTADHGMNAKQTLEGSPKVVYLESSLSASWAMAFACSPPSPTLRAPPRSVRLLCDRSTCASRRRQLGEGENPQDRRHSPKSTTGKARRNGCSFRGIGSGTSS